MTSLSSQFSVSVENQILTVVHLDEWVKRTLCVTPVEPPYTFEARDQGIMITTTIAGYSRHVEIRTPDGVDPAELITLILSALHDDQQKQLLLKAQADNLDPIILLNRRDDQIQKAQDTLTTLIAQQARQAIQIQQALRVVQALEAPTVRKGFTLKKVQRLSIIAIAVAGFAYYVSGLLSAIHSTQRPDDLSPFYGHSTSLDDVVPTSRPYLVQQPKRPEGDVTQSDPQTPAPAYQVAEPVTPVPQIPVQSPQEVAAADNWPLPASIRAGLPKKLRLAADRQLFTVAYSNGHARTLYVFADPECPNCQRLEPALNAAAGQYNVVVFPVAVIGKEKSIASVAPVLCLPPEQRKAAWDALFDKTGDVMNLGKAKPAADADKPDDCEVARQALGVNEVAYQTYRIPGTPWVIADDGRYVSQAVLQDPALLRTFMQTSEVTDAR